METELNFLWQDVSPVETYWFSPPAPWGGLHQLERNKMRSSREEASSKVARTMRFPSESNVHCLILLLSENCIIHSRKSQCRLCCVDIWLWCFSNKYINGKWKGWCGVGFYLRVWLQCKTPLSSRSTCAPEILRLWSLLIMMSICCASEALPFKHCWVNSTLGEMDHSFAVHFLFGALQKGGPKPFHKKSYRTHSPQPGLLRPQHASVW